MKNGHPPTIYHMSLYYTIHLHNIDLNSSLFHPLEVGNQPSATLLELTFLYLPYIETTNYKHHQEIDLYIAFLWLIYFPIDLCVSDITIWKFIILHRKCLILSIYIHNTWLWYLCSMFMDFKCLSRRSHYYLSWLEHCNCS